MNIPGLLGGGALSPWLLVGVGAVVLATSGVAGYHGYQYGYSKADQERANVQARWDKEKLDRATQTAAVTKRFTAEKATVEEDARQRVAKLDEEYQRQLSEKEKENAKLRRGVANGAVRLSVAANCPAPRGVAVGVGVGGSPAPATTGVSDGPTRVELPAATSLDILAIGDDADRNTDQLRQAQALIRQYYDQCGPKATAPAAAPAGPSRK